MDIFLKNPAPEAKKTTGKTGSKKYLPDTMGAVSYDIITLEKKNRDLWIIFLITME